MKKERGGERKGFWGVDVLSVSTTIVLSLRISLTRKSCQNLPRHLPDQFSREDGQRFEKKG